MGNILKQLFRSPVKILLFTVLIGLCGAVFSVGYGLYTKNVRELEEIDNQFVTMGTLQQLPERVETVSMKYYFSDGGAIYYTGKPGDTEYTMEYEEPVFGKPITLEDISALPYKVKAEDRPTYLAQIHRGRDGEQLSYSRNVTRMGIFQFTPENDFRLSDGGEIIHRRNALYGKPYGPRGMVNEEGFPAYMYWGAMSDCPDITLEKGKDYISLISGNEYAMPVERCIVTSPYEQKYETVISEPLEITENFFETEEGKELQELADNMMTLDNYPFAVIPTADLNLLMPFYQKEVTLLYGDFITKEQFENGEKVCMIPQEIANDFTLQPGDKLDISLMAKMYGWTSAYATDAARGFINLFDKPIELSEKTEYEIVGIYYSKGSTTDIPEEYSLPKYGVVVPEKSIDNSDVTVIGTGTMQGYNTSFIIENDRINEFREEAEALNLEYGKFSYYDMGYGNVKKGMDQVVSFALVLFAAGAVSSLLIVILFLYLQIMRKSRETAVQISMGFGKIRTGASLLCGVMLIIIAGTVIGTAVGMQVSEQLSADSYNRAEAAAFSTDYSENRVQSAHIEYEFDPGADISDMLAAGGILILAGLTLSLIFVHISLKKEPMLLLSKGGGDI